MSILSMETGLSTSYDQAQPSKPTDFSEPKLLIKIYRNSSFNLQNQTLSSFPTAPSGVG